MPTRSGQIVAVDAETGHRVWEKQLPGFVGHDFGSVERFLSAVWNPIKQGSLTASSDGSFAAATVNGVYPGYTKTVPRNSTVSVFVTGAPVSTTYTQATVTVLLNGYAQTSEIVPLIGGSFTRTYPLSVSTDSYIRVEVSYGIGGSRSGYCDTSLPCHTEVPEDAGWSPAHHTPISCATRLLIPRMLPSS